MVYAINLYANGINISIFNHVCANDTSHICNGLHRKTKTQLLLPYGFKEINDKYPLRSSKNQL